jgi:hypothetical protein
MPNRVLLIGWEAADWKLLHPLIDAGEMPSLRRIVESGISGQLRCTQPMTSVSQWTTIVTGKRPWQHRVCHPIETVTAAGQGVPAGASDWRSAALWEILAQAGKRNLVVGWPATGGAQCPRSLIVSDGYARPTDAPGIKPWPPAASGTYWPPEIGRQLDRWRMSPEDVQADVISLCVPEWKKINQRGDRRLGHLRVFLAGDFSHQAAAMTLFASGDWDFAAVHFPALGAISKIFLPHHFPSADRASGLDFELYQNVIGGTCRLLDQMLGNLVRAAGSNVQIMLVSGHGVTTSIPPAPAPHANDDDAWKSPHGIFAACGPGLASDALVFGASVLDVAPTILASLGLPIGDDMEGRVLVESFDQPPVITRVESWKKTSIIEALPKIEDPAAAETLAAVRLQRERDWNLARSYLDAGRTEGALPSLERLFRGFPERSEFALVLFESQLALHRLAEASETLEILLEGLPPGFWPLVLQAELHLARGETQVARSLANQSREFNPTQPDALRRLGMLWLRLRDWDSLEALAAEAIRLSDQQAVAWLGLAEAKLRKRAVVEAEAAATRAIGLDFYLSDAHFVLTRALVAQGKWQQARDSLQTLLRLQPGNRAAASYTKRIPRRAMP